MALWGADKPDQKQQSASSTGGVGWLRSPEGLKVVRIAAAGESRWATWVEVTDADIASDGRVQVRHSRRMLRFNALQLWQNLIRQGWQRVPPQW
jgi:hypothetical protein